MQQSTGDGASPPPRDSAATSPLRKQHRKKEKVKEVIYPWTDLEIEQLRGGIQVCPRRCMGAVLIDL
jgi:hypothetical protein